MNPAYEHLRSTYGASYHLMVADLHKQIQMLQPFRHSFEALKQHYHNVTQNLSQIQQYTVHQRQAYSRQAYQDHKLQSQLQDMKTATKIQLQKLKTKKEHLQAEKKVLVQKMDMVCQLAEQKLQNKQKLMTKIQQQSIVNKKIGVEAQQIQFMMENVTKLDIAELKDNNMHIVTQNAKIRTLIMEIKADCDELRAEINKIDALNDGCSQEISRIVTRTNDILKMYTECQKAKQSQLIKYSRWQQKISHISHNRQVVSHKQQLQKLRKKQLQQCQQVTSKLLDNTTKTLIKLQREIDNDILPAIKYQQVYIAQNQTELHNLYAYLQELKQTNAMMLAAMGDACYQDNQVIVKGIFSDKCEMLNQMSDKVAYTGAIVRQKSVVNQQKVSRIRENRNRVRVEIENTQSSDKVDTQNSDKADTENSDKVDPENSDKVDSPKQQNKDTSQSWLPNTSNNHSSEDKQVACQ